jgi:hypothetical protein
MTEPQLEGLVIEDDLALDRDLETPLDDALEQALPVTPEDLPERADIPFEANEADAYEQSLDIGPDDDYR